MYSISSCSFACRRESSASAEHGIICIFGNSCFNLSRFSFAPGLSILFAAINIGFVMCLRVSVKFAKSSSDHDVGLSGSSFSFIRTSLISSSETPSPENCFARETERSCFVVWIVLESFSQTFSKIALYHLLSSFSSILTS